MGGVAGGSTIMLVGGGGSHDSGAILMIKEFNDQHLP